MTNQTRTVVLFDGIDANGKSNLWITDGSRGGTSELSVAGASSSGLNPSDLTVFGTGMLLAGVDATGKNGLWVTDGTGAGTSELSIAGANSYFGLDPSQLTVFGSEVLFQGQDANFQSNLWVTNGSATGTTELSVAGASGNGLLPADLTVFGSEVLFAGEDTNYHSNLWVMSGIGGGISELSIPGTSNFGLEPNDLTVFGTEVLFVGEDSHNRSNLWVTDGTAEGTSELSVTGAYNGVGGLDASDLTVFGSLLLFDGTDADDNQNLWVINGPGGAISELTVAAASSDGLAPSDLTVFGSEVLFKGDDADNHPSLWVSDGTAGGTSELTVAGAAANGLSPSNLTVMGSEVMFAGVDANNAVNLWVTDGTALGTSEVSVAGAADAASYNLAPTNFAMLGSEVLFAGNDSAHDTNLWRTDGTAAGTSELSVLGAYPLGLLKNTNASFVVLGNEALFVGDDQGGSGALWVTDGTAGGTSELSIAGAAPSGAYDTGFAPTSLTQLDGKVLFAGVDTNGLDNLWVTDGTVIGTTELTVAGENASYGLSPTNLTVFGTEVLFDGYDTNNARSLWVTDGTAAGTSELSIVTQSGSGPLVATNLTVFGTEVLFIGSDAGFDGSLWVSNGTGAGTSMLNVAGGLPSYEGGLFNGIINPDFTIFGSNVLFEATDAGARENLWTTDGTAAGTSELSVAGEGPNGLFIDISSANFTVLGAKVLFEGTDASGNVNLWTTDGTAAGTSELSVAGANADGGLFFFNQQQANPNFIVLGNEALFAGYDAAGQVGLWVTDGSAAGTSELSVARAYGKGLLYDGNGADPNFSRDGSEVLFEGTDPAGFQDLWLTNGTAAGTSEVFPTFSPELEPSDLIAYTLTGNVATIAWGAPISGDFAVAANWTPATIPNGTENAELGPGGTYTVSSTADETVDGLTTAANATLNVEAGTFTILDQGFGTTDNAGTLVVDSGGTLTLEGTISNSGAIEALGGLIELAGTASGITVDNGGEEYIGASGFSRAAQISGGGAEVVFGTDSDAALRGTQYDFNAVSGGTTLNGGYQLVAPGAVASGMTVELGGQQYVGSGGTALGTLVQGGGAEVAFGVDSGTSVSGTQYLYGTASGGTTESGGFQLVAPGATAIGMTVAYGGEQYVGSGGTTLGAIIASGGAEEVHGFDSGASLSGTQYLYGTAFGGTTYGNGEQLVAPGATASGMTVESGGQQYIGSGGTALVTPIVAQGVEQVFGRDSGALVSGTQYVFGAASGGTTFNGGSQQVEFGATAIGMTLSAGGQQNVGGGGTVIGSQIMSQGAEIVHGTDLNAVISGTQYVDGLASGTVVGAGGYQLVSAGGTISAASISGGTIELMGGASNGTAPISFAGAGQLILDASTSFSGTVAGFDSASQADSIDLADIPYVSAGSAGATTVTWTPTGASSGTLMVAEGSHAADITLLGQYTGTFAGSNDGHGGTLVTYAPAAGAIETDPLVASTGAAHI